MSLFEKDKEIEKLKNENIRLKMKASMGKVTSDQLIIQRK